LPSSRAEAGPVATVLGRPWERPLQGRCERHFVDSEVLRDNPLDDPARRPLYVYLPPGLTDGPHVSVYVIQGMTGQVDMWLNRTAFELNMIERLDELFATTDCPRAVVVMVDAWTSVGGSQFINSAATGRYLDYLCDEVVPFVDERFPTSANREHRGLSGKSSGGYGAMVVPMLRPDVFSGLASHAGDALFEACYLPEFPLTTRTLRDRFESSYEVFWKHFRAASSIEPSLMAPLNTYAMAACYSPDEDRPGEVVLPFEIDSGKLIDEVWARWLKWDPVRMAPQRPDALHSLRHIYLDAGRSDEYFLDLGAQAVAKELRKLGVEHTLELFDGTHGGLQYRYPGAIAALATALAG
jgi:S-formylglutathione hydrolase FrmB